MKCNRHETHSDAASVNTDTDERATLNVVIAYDDVPAGWYAMHILGEVAGSFGDKIESCPQLWRFDFLEGPDWRTLATLDVLNADILIISTCGEYEFSAAIRSWVNSCLNQKRGDDLAVVALLGRADKMNEPDSPRFQFVQRTARDAGIDFFAPLARHEDSPETTIESIQRRAEVVTPILHGILQSHTPYRHWGINE